MAFWRRALRTLLSLTILASMFPWLAGTAQNGDAKQKTQDLAATWQGTLGPGQGMRVVIQVTEGTRGEYRALFYNIKGRSRHARRKLERVSVDHDVCISVMTEAEMRFPDARSPKMVRR